MNRKQNRVIRAMKGVLDMGKGVINSFVQGAPPRPCREAEDVMRQLGVGLGEVHAISRVFHQLKQRGTKKIVMNALEVPSESLIQMVSNRREWVTSLLRNLVELGGCHETIKWDNFMYIFLRFCSLSKIELCQLMFFIIIKDVKSWTVHYLTASQLDEFYDPYRDCPVMSFCTKDIFFSRLPLSRYYISDFVELCYRFGQMINPLLHLQRNVQQCLPSITFWENYDRAEIFNRKLTLEFFLIKKTHFFLQGEPPLRESADMLLPLTMGAQPVHHDYRQSDPKAAPTHLPGGVYVDAYGNQVPVEGHDTMQGTLSPQAAPGGSPGVPIDPDHQWRPSEYEMEKRRIDFEKDLRALPSRNSVKDRHLPKANKEDVQGQLRDTFAPTRPSQLAQKFSVGSSDLRMKEETKLGLHEEEEEELYQMGLLLKKAPKEGKKRVVKEMDVKRNEVPRWMKNYVHDPLQKTVAEKAQEIDFIKKSRERGALPGNIVVHMQQTHKGPVIMRPEETAESLKHLSDQ